MWVRFEALDKGILVAVLKSFEHFFAISKPAAALCAGLSLLSCCNWPRSQARGRGGADAAFAPCLRTGGQAWIRRRSSQKPSFLCPVIPDLLKTTGKLNRINKGKLYSLQLISVYGRLSGCMTYLQWVYNVVSPSFWNVLRFSKGSKLLTRQMSV